MNLTPFCLEMQLKRYYRFPQLVLMLRVAHNVLLYRVLRQAGWKVTRVARYVSIKSPSEIALRVPQLWPDCPKTILAALDAYSQLSLKGALRWSKAEREDRMDRRRILAEQIHRLWNSGIEE